MSDGVIVGTTGDNGTGYGYGGQVKSNSGLVTEFLYVPADTEKGEVLVKSFDGDEETNPKAVAVATSALTNNKIVVASKDQGATAGFQDCIVKGYCEALVDGTTDVAKDDFLEVINGADGAVKDNATRSANSFAIACEAQATDSDVLTDVYVLDNDVVIASS